MKKLLALLFALTMVLSLAACGGEKTDDPKDAGTPSNSQSDSDVTKNENKKPISDVEITSMKMGKVQYVDDGAFNLNVTVEWKGTPEANAWIGIIPADVPHGSEEKNDEFDIHYLYFGGMKSGDTFTFENITLEPGAYTLRINESDDGGAELAWCGFSVSNGGKVKIDDKDFTLLHGDKIIDTSTDKKIITDGSKLGVLQTVAEQQEFVIKGLYLTTGSGQHKYTHVDDIDTFGTDSLNSEYELNEWIEFYIDTEFKSPMNIYFVRNDNEADYSKITEGELKKICSDKDYPVLADVVTDADNHGYVGQAYVNPANSEPDLFNVFFVANGKVCYMVQLDLIAQTSAE